MYGIFTYIWLIFIVNLGKLCHTRIQWDMIYAFYESLVHHMCASCLQHDALWGSDCRFVAINQVRSENHSSDTKISPDPLKMIWHLRLFIHVYANIFPTLLMPDILHHLQLGISHGISLFPRSQDNSANIPPYHPWCWISTMYIHAYFNMVTLLSIFKYILTSYSMIWWQLFPLLYRYESNMFLITTLW